MRTDGVAFTTDIEKALVELGRDVEYPPMPDLLAAARVRLASRRSMANLYPAIFPPRRLVGAFLAAIAILGVVTGVSPAARATLTQWLTHANPPLRGISSVDFVTPKLGWVAVVQENSMEVTVMETTNGGRDWKEQFRPTLNSLGSISNTPVSWLHFVDSQHGYLYLEVQTESHHSLRTPHVLYRTIDAGQAWHQIALPAHTANHRIELSFPSARNGFLIDDGRSASVYLPSFYRTSDGGNSWSRLGPLTQYRVSLKRSATGQFGTHHVLNSTGALGRELDFQSATSGWIFGQTTAGVRVCKPVRLGSGKPVLLCTRGVSGENAFPDDYRTLNSGRTWLKVSMATPPLGARLGPRSETIQEIGLPRLTGHSGLLAGLLAVWATAQRLKTVGSIARSTKSGYFIYSRSPDGHSWVHPRRIYPGIPGVGSEHSISGISVRADIANARHWFFLGGGRIHSTVNAGRSWSTSTKLLPIENQGQFGVASGMEFFTSRSGVVWFAPGSAGVGPSQIESTVDGGRTWRLVSLPSGL